MTESIVIALAGGLMGAVLAFPLGSFSGWQKCKKAVNKYNRRKEAEARLEEQEAAKKSKRTAYDFTQDETIQFPFVEESK
ncbi:MAG: hypothetical protein Q4P20_11530 [Eubacteriales bacterium]|nr:hypothetical protein [Eubacteriales bacterium]